MVSENFDLCFHGINLSGALIALAALKAGLKVEIHFDRPLNWEYSPELVTICPLRLDHLISSYRKIKFFEKVSSLFPSQVSPQRILTLSDKIKFSSKTAFIVDILLHRDREISSLPINLSKFPSFNGLVNHFKNGLLVQEFRFDRNKAIIEILLMCRQLGACIIYNPVVILHQFNEKSKVSLLPSDYNSTDLKIENFTLNLSNHVRIVTNNVEITSRILGSTTILHFLLKRKMQKDDFINHVCNILKTIGIDTPKQYENELLKVFENFTPTINQEKGRVKLLYDHEISNFKNGCKKDAKRISNAIGKNIGFKKFFKTLVINRFDGNSVRIMQAQCDEKFDLAKQTGIEYQKFCYYFYRYYGVIDEFIESAYQKMNSFRTDPQCLWEAVEKEFKEKIEAELFS